MDRRDDHDDLEEALRLFEAEGDSSSFESWVMARVPLHQHERVRRVLRNGTKRRRSRKSSGKIPMPVLHANAIEYLYRGERTSPPSDAEINAAAARFGVKANSLINLIGLRNQQSVNEELRRRGFVWRSTKI